MCLAKTIRKLALSEFRWRSCTFRREKNRPKRRSLFGDLCWVWKTAYPLANFWSESCSHSKKRRENLLKESKIQSGIVCSTRCFTRSSAVTKSVDILALQMKSRHTSRLDGVSTGKKNNFVQNPNMATSRCTITCGTNRITKSNSLASWRSYQIFT